MKQGALIFDKESGRYNIRFGLNDYYGGLHCGECFDVFAGGKWKPTRIEMSTGQEWYLVGIHPQDEALKQGIYTQEDYKEFARITDFLAQAGFTPEKEFCFDGKPFSLHGDTPEQAAPEAKTIYYTINEGAARRANDANSFYDYKPGSATAEYRQMVDRALEIGEHQKKRVDPMYHEKIDSLVDTYARKLAENMNSSFSIEARVPSILIAGGSNFPVRKKEKQNAARDRNMEDWNEIQGLLDKIRSTGMGGISADDPQAIQKLEAKLEKLQAAQETMKAVNAYCQPAN